MLGRGCQVTSVAALFAIYCFFFSSCLVSLLFFSSSTWCHYQSLTTNGRSDERMSLRRFSEVNDTKRSFRNIIQRFYKEWLDLDSRITGLETKDLSESREMIQCVFMQNFFPVRLYAKTNMQPLCIASLTCKTTQSAHFKAGSHYEPQNMLAIKRW